mmetsp:Transcript_139810/g.268082  ORF Transcript_139810/g.268082 Transcript_139810/m.268082 type:complete len:1137 (+) Transcript_139810:59-3469(+)
MPEADSKIISRWDECYETYRELSSPPPDVEPRMLEISYPSPDNGEPIHEVIFEDPVKDDSEIRLLVPLRAILSLKRLCERDFERFRAASSVLSDCRVAYYKELQYLREQLQAATRTETPATMMMDDYVKNYEVYWFNPPSYVDEELKDFLQTCIRWTNKQLIEENYKLRCQAEGVHVERPGDQSTSLDDLIAKVGVKRLVQRIYDKIKGDEKLLAEFEAAIVEMARGFDGGEREEEPKEKVQKVQRVVEKEAPVEYKPDPGMLEELEVLRKKVRDGEDLKTKYLELQQQYDEAIKDWEADGAKAASASELERLLAEERAQSAKLQSQLASSSKPAPKPAVDPEITQLHDHLPKLADRIRACAVQISDGTAPFLGKGKAGASSSPSKSDSGPDDVAGASSRIAGGRGTLFSKSGGASQLQDAVTMLEDAMAKLKPTESAMEKELRERLRRAHEDNSKLKDVTRQLESELKAEREKLNRQVTPVVQQEEPQGNPELEAECDRLRTELQSLGGKLKSAQDANRELRGRVEELQTVVMRKDAKIYELKEECKRLKHKAGEPVDDDSDDEAEGDDSDIPDWMKAYWRRVKHSVKPRWMLLNEDASCANIKREHIISSRLMFSSGRIVDAQLALEFLRRQAVADEAFTGEPSPGPLNVRRTPLQEPTSARKTSARIDSISPMVVYQELPVSITGRGRPYVGSDCSPHLTGEPERRGESPVAIGQRQASPVSGVPRVETSRGGVHTLKVVMEPERNLVEATSMLRREQVVSTILEQSTARRTPSRDPLRDDELTARQPEAGLGGAQENCDSPLRVSVANRVFRATSAHASSPGKARQNQTLDAASPPDKGASVLLPLDALTGWTVGELVGTAASGNSLAESSSSTAEPSVFLLAGPSVATSTGAAGEAPHREEPDEGAAQARSGTRRPATAVPQKPGAAHQDAPFGPTVAGVSRPSSRSRILGGGLQGQSSPSLSLPQELWQKRPATAGGQQPLRHEAPALGACPFNEQRCRSAGQLRTKGQLAALPGAVWRANSSSTLPITNAPLAGAGAQSTGRSPVSVPARPNRSVRESGGGSPARPGQATEAAVRILDTGITNRPSPARSGAGDENLGKGTLLLPGVSPAMPPGRVRKSTPAPSWLLPP